MNTHEHGTDREPASAPGGAPTNTMMRLVDTRDTPAVEAEVTRLYEDAYPDAVPGFVAGAFAQLQACFGGANPKYQPIDVRYHDLEHTMQGTLCLARILHGRRRAGVAPVVDRRLFELGLLAVLMHDTGYLKRPGDTEGTGAKYTAVHVIRSAEFAAECLPSKGLQPAEIRAVQNMIRCTGVGLSLEAIHFQSEAERVTGYALGTADLLGQMAAADYIEKLPVLFEEFAEAAGQGEEAQASYARFPTADALMRDTHQFWSRFVWPRLNREFGGLYRFLEEPYPGGPNWYVQQIEVNLVRLLRLLEEQDRLAERGGGGAGNGRSPR